MRKNNKQPVIYRDILVEDYAAEGKSLARIDGKVVFIEKTVPGDVVDIQLLKNKKDWGEAWVLEYKKYSDERQTPFCEHFGTCGGCQWQMLPYAKQLQFKHQQVVDNLSRIAKVELPEILPIIGADAVKLYRNKVEYTFANKKYYTQQEFNQIKADGKDFKQVMMGSFGGFHAKGSFDKVVEINECHLQEEPTNKLRKSMVDFCRTNNISFYDAKTHEGWLRGMMVRIATTGQIMINIMVGYDDSTLLNSLMEHIIQHFPDITTILYTINTKWNDSIYDLTPIVFKGNGYILENLEEFQFKVSPKSFFQTNTKQAEKLYNVTRDFAELTGTQTVYDLYCGTGSIGIFVSHKAKKIIGVEVIDDAIGDAKENAALNNLDNCSFFVGDAEKVCNDEFFAKHGKPDVIITDPPRVGMSEKLVKKLLEIEAPLIVYVSCNPATQARDLAWLDEKYTVTKVQPVDMFPQTHHIENVVQLKLK